MPYAMVILELHDFELARGAKLVVSQRKLGQRGSETSLHWLEVTEESRRKGFVWPHVDSTLDEFDSLFMGTELDVSLPAQILQL